MIDYMDRRVTPPKRVTLPTWGPPLLCKEALRGMKKKKEVYVRVARQKITMAQQEESISFLATSHQILIQPSFY